MSSLNLDEDLSANTLYNLASSDSNCNVEAGSTYVDLYEDFDSTSKVSRKSGTSSRQKYASLDPASMGVNIEFEALSVHPSNNEDNLNEEAEATLYYKEALQKISNENLLTDSNHNQGMNQKSELLDCNTSLKSLSNDENIFHSYNSDDSDLYHPISDSLFAIENSVTTATSTLKASNCPFLPTGWEKHEDDNGPYYWHINSGTIQRDPPISKLPSSCHNLVFNEKSCHNIFKSTYDDKVFSVQFRGKQMKSPDVSEGVTAEKRPIRFAVRSLGWVEISEKDLTPERSSKAVNKCIVDLSMGRNDILDVVGCWGDGKDLFMDLDDCSLCLMATQDLTVLNIQPIHTIRVWGVGRDNGRERDFAYVSRDQSTKKYMCHVFRCDIPARIIANTLRDICKKNMIERGFHENHRIKESSAVATEKKKNASNVVIRPTELSMHQQLFSTSNSAQIFPTPMDEPKKVLKVHYLGSTNVDKATGVQVLNHAIETLSSSIEKHDYKFVNVAVAPSTITICEPNEGDLLAECRVRFLSFLGIGRDVKFCGFIVHTAQNSFVAHVFFCEPSSGALCKTIEAACKLRYQKCLDAHGQDLDSKLSNENKKSIKTALKNVFGSLFSIRD